MFRGLIFFIKNGWKYDKLYVIYRVANMLVTCFLPILATVMPKFIIDELMGECRAEKLILYVGILTFGTLFSHALGAFFSTSGFTHRIRVNFAFDLALARRLSRADLAQIESPDFNDMRKKAENFLSCGWHGFGYLLDCALDMLGHCVTLMGIAAIVATLNIWLTLAFVALSALGAWVESRAKKQVMSKFDIIAAKQRGITYYSNLFSDVNYAKELRAARAAKHMLGKYGEYLDADIDISAWQNRRFMASGILNAGFTFIQQALSYAFLLFRAAAGRLTIGNFTLYAGAITTFAASTRAVLNDMVEIRAFDRYYDSLDTYLNLPAKLRAGSAPPPTNFNIEFRDVSYIYPGQTEYALKNINL